MKIEEIPTTKVLPYQSNNRVHTDTQIDRIASSIKEFGFNQPIVVDEDYVVLIGHGRLLAAQKLELLNIPVLRVDKLSDAQKKAYRILDNKLQNDSSWDFENLQLELQGLEQLDFDLASWGLDDLYALLPAPEPIEDDDFDPETCENTECFIKPGDVIKLGKHTVVCGDCSATDSLPTKAALWITDPPYGVSYVGKTKDALTIENDDLDAEGVAELWSNATTFALDNLLPGASCYASVPSGPLYFTFLKEWIERDIYRQQLIWLKDSMVLGHSDYHYKHEPILYGWKPDSAHYFIEDRTKTSVFQIKRPKASKEHPTMKPLELLGEMIANSTKPGALVLDTFLGSGTTLIACEQLSRVCYGIEISPKYCEVIIQRYKQHCEANKKPFKCLVNGEKYSPTSVL